MALLCIPQDKVQCRVMQPGVKDSLHCMGVDSMEQPATDMDLQAMVKCLYFYTWFINGCCQDSATIAQILKDESGIMSCMIIQDVEEMKEKTKRLRMRLDEIFIEVPQICS
ncbi:hypothetical protein SELMODRAFT_421419 [Selaginella moellendorffii]|uniref:Uncharacterized protein n=1 Tax=Selaginella moellendorffii TaxID=88036 RepID=D8SF80_SELML|nr:hypothetical protein SELMODRAFT_421419 [Selaginella moellendorffii]